jgi:hypothetical protein
LAPLAALCLLVIIFVAIATSGRQRINLYKPIDEADRIDDCLFTGDALCRYVDHGRLGRRRAVQPRRPDPGFDFFGQERSCPATKKRMRLASFYGALKPSTAALAAAGGAI